MWLREPGPGDGLTRGQRDWLRKRARMAVDPVYREQQLAGARERSARFRQRHARELAGRRREQDRARYAADRESITRRKREQYVGERAERTRATNRRSYERNKAALSQRRKDKRREHGDSIREKERVARAAWYKANAPRRLEYNRAWRARNLERSRAYVRTSGLKRRSAMGEFKADEWFALLARYGGRCAYCGGRDRIEADHRIPLCRGGTNRIDNILPACMPCNRRKHRKTEEEFRAFLATESSAVRARSWATPAARGGSARQG